MSVLASHVWWCGRATTGVGRVRADGMDGHGRRAVQHRGREGEGRRLVRLLAGAGRMRGGVRRWQWLHAWRRWVGVHAVQLIGATAAPPQSTAMLMVDRMHGS